MVVGIPIRDLDFDHQDPGIVFEVVTEFEDLRKKGKIRLQPIWLLKGQHIHFLRRTLEVAHGMAYCAKQKYKAHIVDDYEEVHRLANIAEIAVSELASHVAFGKQVSASLLDSRASDKVTTAVNHLSIRLRNRIGENNLDSRLSRELAREQAQAMFKTIEVCKFLSEQAAHMRKEVAALTYNVGSPEKSEFARAMFEGWIALTGDAPSEKNSAFLAVLEAAWRDIAISPTEESWAGHIRKAAKNCGQYERQKIAKELPHWK